MRAEILLKYDEKERLLASACLESPARLVLNGCAEEESTSPRNDKLHEQAAGDLLRVAQRYYGNNLESNAQADEEAWVAEIDS